MRWGVGLRIKSTGRRIKIYVNQEQILAKPIISERKRELFVYNSVVDKPIIIF